jgi:transposase
MKVYIGIDWSENKHDVCYQHENGEVLRSLQIGHIIAGFVELDKVRMQLGLTVGECVVGLETAHNLLLDYLWDQGYEQVYILPPNVVKSAQGRYRQSGAKDDRWDARLIADILRTDQKRYTPWKPDSPLTRQIRAGVRFLYQVNKELVRNSNRLRSVLLRYYPAATQVFSRLDGLITLAFIRTYPTPQAAAALSFEDFETFLRDHHYTHAKAWAKSYARLQDTYPQPNPGTVAAYSPQAVSLAKILEQLVACKNEGLAKLGELYVQHPDPIIYDHLPMAGALIEPALLAKLGDDRMRYPNPAVLQAVAGTCPVTYQSGKSRNVRFRRACDREFRDIVQQWARLTIDASPWAAAYYRSVRPRCQNDNDAFRRLANRWLEVVWKLWQDRKAYNEEYHLKQHTLRCKSR